MSKLVKVRINVTELYAKGFFPIPKETPPNFLELNAEIVEEKKHYDGGPCNCEFGAPCHRPAKEECVCKEPWTKGVIHRTDGPCHLEPRPSKDLSMVEKLDWGYKFGKGTTEDKLNELTRAHNSLVQFIRDGK